MQELNTDHGRRAVLAFNGQSGETAHATRDSVTKTPLFLEHRLSGGDSGRVLLIRARSGLCRVGEKRDWPSETRGDLEPTSQIPVLGTEWAIP